MIDVIFDLDGTLIDSHECIFGIYEKLFKEMGLKLPEEKVLRTFIGPPVEEVMKRYASQDGLKSACDRFRALYQKVDLKETNKLYQGVKEMLETLYKDGYRLFIGSTKNEEKANLIPEILGIRRFFTAVYGSRDEIGRISKTQVLNELCKDYSINKENAVLIGDTHFDAEGAKEAGINVAIVKYGFGDMQKLKEFDVKFYAESPRQVVEYIRSL